MKWLLGLILALSLLAIPVMAYDKPVKSAYDVPKIACPHPVPYANAPCNQPSKPAYNVVFKSSLLCWSKANFPQLYNGKVFDIACPSEFMIEPMCVSTPERAKVSHLPLCLSMTHYWGQAPMSRNK